LQNLAGGLGSHVVLAWPGSLGTSGDGSAGVRGRTSCEPLHEKTRTACGGEVTGGGWKAGLPLTLP